MSIRINGKKYINGTVVRANPVEEVTGTLEKIGIGSDVYEIQGGGSDVEANPTDPATDTLTTIGIDGTVYDIAGGGGSSSGVYIEKELWADANGLEFYPSLSPQITLSDGLSNYDFVYLDTTIVGDNNYHNTNLIAVSAIYKQSGKYNGIVNIGVHVYNNPSFEYVDDTHIKLVGYASTNHLIAWRFVGIKVSGDYYSPVIYSTEEREIGVWTDNKPLYQKTFNVGALTGGTTKEISISGLNIDRCTYILGSAKSTQYGYQIPILDMTPSNANGAVRPYIDGNNEKLSIVVGSQVGDLYDVCEITIQYTKTTDVAGSGSYNTLGVPTVHYTTDEQVIGTWIDGKPLYRKTVIKSGTISQRETVSLGIANVENIFLVSDASNVNNGQTPLPLVTGTDNSNNTGGFFDIQQSDTSFLFRIGSGMAGYVENAIITVQYTKTTDQ